MAVCQSLAAGMPYTSACMPPECCGHHRNSSSVRNCECPHQELLGPECALGCLLQRLHQHRGAAVRLANWKPGVRVAHGHCMDCRPAPW
jgi:hypothetical protein